MHPTTHTVRARLRSLSRHYRPGVLAEPVASAAPVAPSAAAITAAFVDLVRAQHHTQNFDPAVQDALTEGFRYLYDTDLDRALPPAEVQSAIVDQFHRLYYHDRATWRETTYRGTTIWKCPLDLWLYQELLHEVRPDLIVETGTAYGGSAFYLGDLCDTLGRGRVLTIDIEEKPGRPAHDRVTYLHGSSTSPDILAEVGTAAAAAETVLVILDSDHSEHHVAEELRAYADLVTHGSYLIVEDTNVNGHPALPDFGPGPMEALNAFIAERTDFRVDSTREKFRMTFNPRGYLRKIA